MTVKLATGTNTDLDGGQCTSVVGGGGGGGGMPSEWTYYKTLKPAKGQAFLIANGALDTIAFKDASGECIYKVYGGTNGTTLLFQDTVASNVKWDMYDRDPTTYPLPIGCLFSNLTGKTYTDDEYGTIQLFTVTVERTNAANISTAVLVKSAKYASSTAVYTQYNAILAYYGDSAPANMLFSYGALSSYRCKYVELTALCTVLYSYAFSNLYGLIQVDLGGVSTTVGAYALNNCFTLKRIIFPVGVTSITIGVLHTCNTLSDISLPDGLLSIGQSMVQACYSLKNISIPATVTEGYNSIFYNCLSLESITYTGTITTAIPGLNMFRGCMSLRYIDMAGFKITTLECYGNVGLILTIGSYGNISGQDVPIRIHWADSLGGTGTVINLSYTSITEAQMLAIAQDIVDAKGANCLTGKTVVLTGSPCATSVVQTALADTASLGATVTI